MYNSYVYVNCPYEDSYLNNEFVALAYILIICDFLPQIASQGIGDERFGRMYEMMRSSRLAVSDLSGHKGSGKRGLNMAYELGLLHALDEQKIALGQDPNTPASCERRSFVIAHNDAKPDCSDIARIDPILYKTTRGLMEGIRAHLRNRIVPPAQRKAFPYDVPITQIYRVFEEFEEQLDHAELRNEVNIFQYDRLEDRILEHLGHVYPEMFELLPEPSEASKASGV